MPQMGADVNHDSLGSLAGRVMRKVPCGIGSSAPMWLVVKDEAIAGGVGLGGSYVT
jgi:hypothetical protein